MRHIEKVMVTDKAVGTERGVTVTVEMDVQALAQRAWDSMGRKSEFADGLVKVSVKAPKR